MSVEEMRRPAAGSPTDGAAPPPAFPGNCSICGHRGAFTGRAGDARNTYSCPACGATHRFREQAAAILTLFARGRSHFLANFARQAEGRNLAVLEYALASPFARRLGSLPDYHRAAPFDDAAPGEVRHGVSCQSLERLTYPDACFDLVITSDVLQHLFDVDGAVAEVSRVLRRGGAHVAALPLRFPLADTTAVRARRVGDRVEHLAEPVFDEDPFDGPRLVVSEFGVDLLALHARHGLFARFHRGEPLLGTLRDNAVLVARKT